MHEAIEYDCGLQPVTNRFLHQKDEKSPRFPMKLGISVWGSMQLLTPFPIDEVTPRFGWITAYEPEDHLDELTNCVLSILALSNTDTIVGFSFKDYSFLDRLEKITRAKAEILDPITDFGLENSLVGIESLQKNFTPALARRHLSKNGPVSLLVARHVIEHAYDITAFFSSIAEIIGEDGHALIELPDCEKGLKNGDCALLWEEHIHYFTANTFKRCLSAHNFTVIAEFSWEYSLENCICYLIKPNCVKKRKPYNQNNNASRDIKLFESYIDGLENNKLKIKRALFDLRQSGRTTSIFGAGHLTSTFIAFNEIEELIDYVVDDDDNKIGLFMANGGIPIRTSRHLLNEKNHDCLLGLNPNHHRNISQRLMQTMDKSCGIYSIFPNTEKSLV